MATRTRRSGLDRVCEYFEMVSNREAEAAFMLVSKIMQERTGKVKQRRKQDVVEIPGEPADLPDEEGPIAAARAKRAAGNVGAMANI